MSNTCMANGEPMYFRTADEAVKKSELLRLADMAMRNFRIANAVFVYRVERYQCCLPITFGSFRKSGKRYVLKDEVWLAGSGSGWIIFESCSQAATWLRQNP